MSGIFITGTDTGVGKTFVTLALADFFIRRGVDVGVMKPVSAGPLKDNDAVYLKKALRLKDPLELMNPVRVRLPLAPYAAAGLSGRKIRLSPVFRAFRKLAGAHELVLVEGIGGALVPLGRDYFAADLARDLRLPALIVARAGLGTINHTLLTVEALRARGVEIIGIALNGCRGKELSEKTNAEVIRRISGVPLVWKIKWRLFSRHPLRCVIR